MSGDYQDFEYVFGDGSEFCDEESSAEENLRSATDRLRDSLENTPSSDEKLQLLKEHIVSHSIPMKFAIDAFIAEIQRRPSSDATNEAVQSTLANILNFMTTQQIQRVLDAGVIDVNNPSLLIGALGHVDSDGFRAPDLEVVEFLLDQGVDPNTRVDGVSPLTWLIRNTPESHSETSVGAVRLLLSAGALFVQSGAALDPFREAALKRRQGILEVFAENNGDIQAEQEARELLWAASLADIRISESASLFAKVLRSRKSRMNHKTSGSFRFCSVNDLLKARAVDQLEAGLDVILEFYRKIKDPSPTETATIQAIVAKFARAADIRLTSGSEFATLLLKPLSFGFEFASFETPKQADLSFKEFASLALNFCQVAVFREATAQAHLSELLRCTMRQNDIRTQLDELSHPDELGAALCAVTAILRDRQRNQLWTPQDWEYEENLLHFLLKRGAYVRHSGLEQQSPIDMLAEISKLPPGIVERVKISDCCGTYTERVPPLKCQVAKALTRQSVTLNDEEIHYRIFVRGLSVASLREFVRAHESTIKIDGT